MDVDGSHCLRPDSGFSCLSLLAASYLHLGGAGWLPSAGPFPTWRLIRNAGHCGGGEGLYNAGDSEKAGYPGLG